MSGEKIKNLWEGIQTANRVITNAHNCIQMMAKKIEEEIRMEILNSNILCYGNLPSYICNWRCHDIFTYIVDAKPVVDGIDRAIKNLVPEDTSIHAILGSRFIIEQQGQSKIYLSRVRNIQPDGKEINQYVLSCNNTMIFKSFIEKYKLKIWK